MAWGDFPTSFWTEQNAVLLLLAADGTVLGPAQQISRLSTYRAMNPQLVEQGDELLAAWAKYDAGELRSSIIVVAQVNSTDGTVLAYHDLQRIEADVLNVQPIWISLDNAVGLYWSTGPYSDWNEGSWGEHSIHFVALDSVTLAPVSEQVVHSQQDYRAGLFRPLAARIDDLLLSGFSFSFHAGWNCGFATIRCVAD